MLLLQLAERAARHRAERRELAHQLIGACDGAVGDDERARVQLEQRSDHAARSAARAQQQDARLGPAQPEVPAQIGHQSDPVGVVADEILTVQRNRVDRVRELRPRRELVHQVGSGVLVRHRDVDAAAAGAEELEHVAAETLGRRFVQPVAQVLLRLAREHAVDERRPAVSDRVTEETVGVGHGRAQPEREPLCGAAREIGEDPVGARAAHREQRLEHHLPLVEPAVAGGGHQHRVLATHLVDEGRHAEAVLHPAHDVEVGHARLDHHHVGALLEIERDFAQRLIGVGRDPSGSRAWCPCRGWPPSRPRRGTDHRSPRRTWRSRRGCAC